MLIKNSTFLNSAVVALLDNTKSAQHKQLVLAAAVIASLIVWRLYRGMDPSHPVQTKTLHAKQHLGINKVVTPKWRYDEMAHKLIMENTELQCAQLDQGFTQGIGKTLSKVIRQIDGKAVIVNM
ncbi:hypothetical protein [Dyadobacter sp. MSC1_007]|jgi:NADH:ubiquinone oxidoreductase subunit 5 (subunit L)/multisubunit Na+/H+ antiporter MnhA subunit|uniref:hypothetical protein n=1 Tax=Dyadobacter sp. MSC1_007 TaxID=2909264 RepID=UPI002030DC88|nr:hypothetical protein [Dyadobacter sp. MSC1_007]